MAVKGIRFKAGTGAVGPTPPPAIFNPGKDGWLHYWHPDRITTGVGQNVTSWPDAAGSPDNLARVVVDTGAGTPEPILMQEGATKFVRIAGIDLQSANATPTPRSFAILMRHPAAQGMIVARIAGGGISRNSTSGVYRVNPGGGLGSIAGPGGTTGTGTNISGWMLVVGNMDAAGVVLAFQGVDLSPSASYTPPTSTVLTSLQHPVVSTIAPASPTQPAGTFYVDVAAQVVWPTAIGADDRASIHAAFRTVGYPELSLP